MTHAQACWKAGTAYWDGRGLRYQYNRRQEIADGKKQGQVVIGSAREIKHSGGLDAWVKSLTP